MIQRTQSAKVALPMKVCKVRCTHPLQGGGIFRLGAPAGRGRQVPGGRGRGGGVDVYPTLYNRVGTLDSTYLSI